MKSLEEMKNIRKQINSDINVYEKETVKILVGMATCGMAAGAGSVLNKLRETVKTQNLKNVSVRQTGCIGVCQFEPIFEVFMPDGTRTTYVKMTPEKAEKVIKKHIIGGKIVDEYTIGPEKSLDKTTFYKKQMRIVLKNCGFIDPENIDEYIAMDGYFALNKVLTEIEPKEIIKIIKDSGLRGRGGGGFPTGLKWEFASKNESDQKYVCCNADEGDPGAFMDRSLLEGDPHSVLEAMAIAGYAIGSSKGYIYVRAEYPVAVERLKIAIDQARKYGFLGNNIFGTGFNFDIELRLGAGAFVCGEETALLTSIEGKRGEPRPRPPFPAVRGLFGKPTILNNVETFANVPQIILKGSDWFSSIGSEKSKGTKVFALGGKINRTGLVEVPMGTTLREIVEEIGDGIPNNKKFKAAQTGGPSGGCIPEKYLDIPLDYDNLIKIGSMMGSGGLIIMDETTCMVDIAKFFLDFTVDESCGKCTPCRIGTKRLLEMLTDITDGKATMEELSKLEDLCQYIKQTSLCGLGQSAPNPVLSTIKYFRSEYEEHILKHKCSAGVCKNLVQYRILEDKCVGCSACSRICPVGAISGELKHPFKIDPKKCIKCGACMKTCKFSAIVKE